jgi:hypothetical protein
MDQEAHAAIGIPALSSLPVGSAARSQPGPPILRRSGLPQERPDRLPDSNKRQSAQKRERRARYADFAPLALPHLMLT